MKTIIQFIHELGDGGASTLIKDYVIRLKRDGFHVVILMVFPDSNSVNLKIVRDKGIEVRFVFRSKSLLNRLKNKFMVSFFVSKAIKKMISEYKPIVFHIHLGVLHLVKPTSKDFLCGRVKLVYTCHNEPSIMIGDERSVEFRAASYLLAHNNMQILALHEDMANEINSLFGINNTIVVNNGIALERFVDAKPSRLEYRKSLDIPADAFVVGHVGRFSRQKNHLFLLEIFERLSLIDKDAFLLLVGTGELEEQVKSWIQEKRLGDKTLMLTHRQDVHNLMKIMDVFVFPSLYEGLGIVLIEAQAAKLRCVISDTIPRHAIVSNYVSVVGLNDIPDKWVDEIMKTRQHKDYVADFSQWNINDIVNQLEKIYEL